MTNAQRQKRYRVNFKKTHPSAATLRKQQLRAGREHELAEKTIAASEALGTKLYGLIYCDPPWRYEVYSRITGLNRAAENHYVTLSLDELMALRPPAAPDCALFLWTTPPMLGNAIRLMEAWGFVFRSELIWKKDRIGLGHWFRNKHESLLVGTRGDVPAPAPGTQPASVIQAPRGRHSEKPDIFAEVIQTMYPTVPKLEMFARRRRDDWDAWGNEV